MNAAAVVLAIVFCCSAALAADAGRPLLSANFETAPRAAGWSIGGYPHERSEAEWTDGTSASGTHALRVDKGWWASPRVGVTQLHYYRLRFHAAVEGKGYWFAAFFDKNGTLLLSDHYTSIYPSDDWQRHEFCFRAHFGAVAAEIRFRPVAAPLLVDDVVL